MKMDREIREERINKLKEDRHYCVYVHTNKTNGKMYVGLTGKKPEERWCNGNGYKDKKGRNSSPFWNAIKKYGWDNFEHEIISSGLTEEEACSMERIMIDKLDTYADHKNGYNVKSGGSSGHLCYYHVLQFKLDGTFIKEYSGCKEAAKATNSEQTCIADVCNGKQLSHNKFVWRYSKDINDIDDESKKINLIYQQHSEFWEVYQFDLNGKFIKKWDNYFDIRKAHKMEKWHSSAIKRACDGYNFQTYGYVWRYAKDVPDIEDFERYYFEKYIHVHVSSKKILCFDLNGNYIKAYPSVTSAGNETGVNITTVSQIARKIKNGNHFIFRYATDLPDGFTGNILNYEKIGV